MEPDSGTTNIRNTGSKHWKRWLGVESRCLVPFDIRPRQMVTPSGLYL
jgi:putative SOS response-associated peptidase YedK